MRIHTQYFQLLVIVGSIAGYPLLSALISFSSINNTSASIVLRGLILCSSIALIVRAFFLNIKPSFNPLLLFFCAFWLLYSSRILYSALIDNSELGRSPTTYIVWAFGACLLPAFACTFRYFNNDFYKTAWIIFAGLFIACIMLMNQGSSTYMKEEIEINLGRLNIESLNPISTGHAAASLVIISTFLLLSSIKKSKIQFFILSLGIPIGFSLMLMAASRGPIIAFIISILFYSLTSKGKKTSSIITATFLLALIIPISQLIEDHYGYKVLSRLENLSSENDSGVSGRSRSFKDGWQQFIDNPYTGNAIEVKSIKFYPHNITIEAFMSTGLIGGLFILGIYISAFIATYRLIRANKNSAWIGLLFIQYFIGSQFSSSLYYSNTLWVLVGILCSLYTRPNKQLLHSNNHP